MEFAILSEGSVLFKSNVWIWAAPFMGFVVTLLLRHYGFKNDHSPTLLQRLAVGFPLSLILVSSFNALLSEIGEPSVASIIFVTGFVSEQALLIDLAARLNHPSSPRNKPPKEPEQTAGS